MIADLPPREKGDMGNESLPPPPKRANISKLDAWAEVEDEEDDELECYLRERKGDDSDFGKWWKNKVSTFFHLLAIHKSDAQWGKIQKSWPKVDFF